MLAAVTRLLQIIVGIVVFSGCAIASASNFLYFPDLGKRVLAGDQIAFREVLSKAATTPPGERLEELAEISSRYVRLAPVAFLEE